MIRALLISLLGLSLLACSTSPQRPVASDPEEAWQDRHHSLSTLQQWQLTGRLGIQTENEGWNATLNWKQQQKQYTIMLVAPLGQGTIQLRGDEQRVTLNTGEEEELFATKPEILLYREFGWRVPVSSLRYWVLGLPAPGAAKRELDGYGRLSRLYQNGWEIQFLNYESQGDIELPSKIFINNHRAKVRLVINQWQLDPSEA